MRSNSENRDWVYASSLTSPSIDEGTRNKMFILKNDAKTVLQNMTPISGSGNLPFLRISKGVKRKRSKSHPVLEDESEIVLGLACSASASDSGGSSGTNMLLGRLCTDETKEDASVDLGLGLACSTSENSPESMLNCPSSPAKLLISGYSATVTSAHSEFELNSHGKQNNHRGLNMFLGLESSGVSNTTSVESMCGTRLQLGLSGNLVDIRNFDTMPMGLGPIDVMHETRPQNIVGVQNIPVVDEGSTSARSITCGGYIPSLLMGRKLGDIDYTGTSDLDSTQNTFCLRAATELELETLNLSPSAHLRTSDCTNSIKDRALKTCKFLGCIKGARGASGLCIAHGGGTRCQKEGCNKGAEGRTIYCKAHGGGKRCQSLGCTKSAEGKTDYCISHGGGRRCSYDGCTKAARGKSGLCIRHGGGKRCQKEGCTKSAEGYSGLCISHGGGRRCQYLGCAKGAQGSTMFCKAHGGGKRCMIQGCNKGAEGSTPLCKGHGGGKRCMFDGGGICSKSVHGGTQFCVAHGGGKRCAIQGCTKSARGRTDYCVRHGGGKRCQSEGCDKSAQGSTDFCKAHGGGKRCSWGQEGSAYSGEHLKEVRGELFKGPCDKFARGRMGLCASHHAFVEDQRIHGGATLNATPGIGPGLFWGLASGSTSKRQSCNGTYDEVFDNGNDNAKDQYLDTSENEGPYSRETHYEWMTMTKAEKAVGKGHALTNLSANQVVPRSQSREASFHDRMEPNLSSSLGFAHSHVFLSNNLHSQAAASSHRMVGATQKGAGLTFVNPAVRPRASVMDSPSSCSLIPPNVLVPPSMQREGCCQLQGKNQEEQVCQIHVCDDRAFDISALSLTDERVHGGGLMALIARETGATKVNTEENSQSVVNASSSMVLNIGARETGRSCSFGDIDQFLARGTGINRM